MINNYLKIAWRNIVKGRFYSLVNIIGLSVGLAFTLVIGAYVRSELLVNRELKNADNQYIIQSKWNDPNKGNELVTLAPLAQALYDRYPHLIANYYRFDGVSSNVSKGDKRFRESFQIGDSTLLTMFGFSLLHGNPVKAFANPYSVVITEELAKKYFNKTDVTGETVSIENFSGAKHDFMISGVLKSHSKNSVTSLLDDDFNQFYLPVSAEVFFGRDMKPWLNPHIVSYIELQKGANPKVVEKAMKQLIKKNAPALISENLTPYLVPLKAYYLNVNHGLVKKTIYVLSVIAFFILLMAVVNFINMTISHSTTRLKEIGIRKSLGGLKKHLIFQFLTESIVLVFISTLFAVFLYAAGRNYFSSVLGKEIPSLTAFPFFFIFILLTLSILVGFLAGIYPAFVLSSIKSVDSLKGKLTTVKEKIGLRKALVGFQFSIAAIVFIGALIVSQQINFFFSKDLGFNKDYLISAQVPRDWSREGINRMENIRRQLASMPQVRDATLSFVVPDGHNSGSAPIYKAGADSITAISTQLLYVDEYFASTYNIPLASGVFFSQPGAFTDSSTLVINETQARALGWVHAQDAIGKQLRFSETKQIFTVAGVTKDFHFGSMQQEVPPITFMHVGSSNIFRYFSIKLKPSDIKGSLAALEKKWALLLPGAPFEYKFMDDTLKNLYKSEIQLRKASHAATILALIIVMLGVLGLISLSVQKRTKEIGIRKVLGSSVINIIALFMKEFLAVIIIASIIACPLAYLIMQNWLNGYAYRIIITVQPFLISFLFLSVITALLICLQTMKVAHSNPVNNLKTD
jgi:putative ABC transport system permease protein